MACHLKVDVSHMLTPPAFFYSIDSFCSPAFFASHYHEHQVEVTHAGGAKRASSLGDYIASWSCESSAGDSCRAHAPRFKRQLTREQIIRICGGGRSTASYPSLSTTSEYPPGPSISSTSYLPPLAPHFTGYSWALEAATRRCMSTHCSRTHGLPKCAPRVSVALSSSLSTALQIHGRKSFTIFPPRDLPHLLDSKGCAPLVWKSIHARIASSILIELYRFANFLSPDTSRFPSLSQATAPHFQLLQRAAHRRVHRLRRLKCCCSRGTSFLCHVFGHTGCLSF